MTVIMIELITSNAIHCIGHDSAMYFDSDADDNNDEYTDISIIFFL